MKNYIAYYRVSTKKQGVSGLGLDAQKQAVQLFINDGDIIESFTEVESGKKDQRLELEKAILACREMDATLVIAKLDRLSRNVAFIFNLKDSEVDFVCCDIPEANTLTIGIFAVMAQHEREVISKRTKEALAAKKAKGEKMGTPENLTDKARQKSIETKKRNAFDNIEYRKAFQLIVRCRKDGQSWNKTATELNEAGYRTANKKEFTHVQVQRIFNLYSLNNTPERLKTPLP